MRTKSDSFMSAYFCVVLCVTDTLDTYVCRVGVQIERSGGGEDNLHSHFHSRTNLVTNES